MIIMDIIRFIKVFLKKSNKSYWQIFDNDVYIATLQATDCLALRFSRKFGMLWGLMWLTLLGVFLFLRMFFENSEYGKRNVDGIFAVTVSQLQRDRDVVAQMEVSIQTWDLRYWNLFVIQKGCTSACSAVEPNRI